VSEASRKYWDEMQKENPDRVLSVDLYKIGASAWFAALDLSHPTEKPALAVDYGFNQFYMDDLKEAWALNERVDLDRATSLVREAPQATPKRL
jgi:hypothetical protein